MTEGCNNPITGQATEETEVEALQATIARLRAALGPFARCAEENDLAERAMDDAIEVPVVDVLAAALAFSLTR